MTVLGWQLVSEDENFILHPAHEEISTEAAHHQAVLGLLGFPEGQTRYRLSQVQLRKGFPLRDAVEFDGFVSAASCDVL